MVSEKDCVKAWIPATSFCVALVTLATTLTIALASDQYIGNIPWPYFSDTGRERTYGQYYIFSIGLTVSAGFWVATQAGMRHWLSQAMLSFPTSAHVARCRAVGVTCGTLAAPFLPLLAWFDTVNFPTIHNFSAYLFFLFAVAAVTSYTIAFYLIRKAALAVPPALDRSVKIKLVVAAILGVAFVIYIPVGLSVGCSYSRLTIADCKREGMSDHYCSSTVRKDDTETLLWNYSACKGTNTMSAIAQHICVYSILTFIGTTYLDFKHADAVLSRAGVDEENAAAAAGLEMPIS